MITYSSTFAPEMRSMFEFRSSIGLSIHPYDTTLARFDKFCLENYPDAKTLTHDIVQGWLTSESLRNTKNIWNSIVEIRYFGKYLNAIGKEAYIAPCSNFPKKPSFAPYLFTDAELAALFHASDTMSRGRHNSLQHAFVSVYYRLIYTCGLRPNEGRKLLRDNVNLQNGEIFITETKKHKERIVVMSDDMLCLCQKYASVLDYLAPRSKYFFPNPEGKPYSNDTYGLIFKNCWARANSGVPVSKLPRVRIYDLRHRFASAILCKWVNDGKDLFAMVPYLRNYMGHANLDSTLYYVHLLPENLLRASGVNWEKLSAVLPEVGE